ncbi:LuxR C-terminal-related transcriptional regulator [uncultured Cellulomonas sp.]|uniref:LuxR C-terminal-related transcriptional regulator n=1 Tax=uncultured Cellulomonas sp. TaxID=189682 RepID=UPI00260CCAD1|nr:LuxR C-terminal-related transcriptional regulator [uncultured Cellulomonas sp.]
MSTQLPHARRATLPASAPLTDRERVVLGCLERDLTLDQIAADLFVTRNTVKTQVQSVYRKLGVRTRADAVARAHECGLR